MPLLPYLARTGRSRRLHMKGTFPLFHQVNDTPVLPGSPPKPVAYNYGEVQGVAGRPGASIAFVYCSPGGPTGGKLGGAFLECCDGFNPAVTGDFTHVISNPEVFAENFTVSYELWFDVEEWIFIDLLDSDLTQFINGNPFPSFNEAEPPQDDGPVALKCEFFELGKAGGQSHVEISYTSSLGPSEGISSTYTLLGGEGMPFGYMAYYELGNIVSGGAAFDLTLVEEQWNGYIDPAYGQSRTDPLYGNTVSIYADGTTFINNCASNSAGGEASATLQSWSTPREDYLLDWRPRCFGEPFPGPFILTVRDAHEHFDYFTAAPEYIGTFAQRTMNSAGFYSFGTTGTFPFASQAIAERSPVYAFVGGAPGVPPPIHDDYRDWRVGIRGKPFQCGTLTHAASATVSSGGSIASPGGSLLPTTEIFEAYRYLQFAADQPASLAIGPKRWDWTVTTPGTPEMITLDLCSPANDSDVAGGLIAVDGRSSRFPLTTHSTSPISNPPNESSMADKLKGQNFGVLTNVTTLAFSNIPATTTLHLGAISLIRNSTATATFLPSFLPQYPCFTDPGDHPWMCAPMFIFKSDDKLCFDMPAMESTGAPEGDSFRESIASMLAYANYFPGMTYTPPGSYPDAWHNGTNTAYFVWGSGAYWSGGYGGAWKDGVELDATGTLQLYAQPLYDQVQGYPGIGDPWESSAYTTGTAMPIRITKHLRGRAAGLVFKTSDGSPSVGTTVNATVTADSEAQGSGITNADGAYETGVPFGFGNVDITTSVQPGNAPSDHVVWNNRHEVRECFRAVPPGCHSPYLLQIENSQLMVSCITADGDIRFRWSPFTAPPWVNDNVITSDGGWSQAPFCQDPRGRLELRSLHTNQGGGDPLVTGVYRLWSDDNGATWSTPEAVNLSANQVQIRASEDGTVIEICFVPDGAYPGPGTFSARTRGPGDATFSTPFVPVDNLGAPLHSDGSGFSLDKAQEGPDRWSLTMVAVGDSDASVWYSADGAETWLRHM